MSELLELPDLDEDDAVMLTDLHTTPGQTNRLNASLASGFGRRVPDNRPQGALSAQLSGFLRR